MSNQFSFTQTPPVGGQDIGNLMPVEFTEQVNEKLSSYEHNRIPNPNPSRCYPRSLNLTRHSVAVFADANAVDSRMASVNDIAQSHHNNEVGHVHAARSGLGDDEEGDGKAVHLPEVLTAAEVSSLLGLAKRTVINRFKDGSILGRRVGRRLIRFHRNTILEQFDQIQNIRPTSLPQLLDVSQIAAFLRINPKTFYALFAGRELKGLDETVALRSPLRFSRARVVEWLCGNGRTVHMHEVA